jgi:hypothetical protein
VNARSRALDSRVHELEANARVADERIQHMTARESDIIEKSRAQIQNQQQTISLLVSEKASLTASLNRLDDLESRRCHFSTNTCLCLIFLLIEARNKEALLQGELDRSQGLSARVHQLEMDLLEAREKHREQVHF